MIFNVDETMLALKPDNRIKHIVPRDFKNPSTIELDTMDSHITLLLCVSADGFALKPSIILPRKNFPFKLKKYANMFHWAGTGEGWVTAGIFAQWIEKVFVPYVQEKRDGEDKPALLFLDGHSSHATSEAIELLLKHNIHAVTIPAHTSHVLQPLDRGVNALSKRFLRAYLSGNIVDEQARSTTFLDATVDALQGALRLGVIQGAWKHSGLWPWDPEKIPHDPSLVIPDDDTPQPPSKCARKTVDISGKLLTSDSMVAALKAKEEAKRLKATAIPKKRGRPKKVVIE
jgi:hypothetical protein